MRIGKILAFKAVFILFAFLLLNCNEKQECDAICEIRKADFERLTTHVGFRIFFSNYGTFFFAKKTPTGAIANYKPWDEDERIEAEFSSEEWLNFIRTLYKYLDKDLNEWGGGDEYCKDYPRPNCMTKLLSIDYPDSTYGVVRYKSWRVKPLDWSKIEKTIDDMRSMIRKKANAPIDTKLKTEYQKKFGEPITDIELSTSRIKFWFASRQEKEFRKESCILVTRTEKGIFLGYKDIPEIKSSAYEWSDFVYDAMPKVELSVDEWLDFIRALYKSGINKWKQKYGDDGKPTPEYNEWVLDIYYSDKSDYNRIKGYNAYPPSWEEFMKVISAIEKKAKITQEETK